MRLTFWQFPGMMAHRTADSREAAAQTIQVYANFKKHKRTGPTVYLVFVWPSD